MILPQSGKGVFVSRIRVFNVTRCHCSILNLMGHASDADPFSYRPVFVMPRMYALPLHPNLFFDTSKIRSPYVTLLFSSSM